MAATVICRMEDQFTLGTFSDGGRDRCTPPRKRELPGGIWSPRDEACEANFAHSTLVVKDLPSAKEQCVRDGVPLRLRNMEELIDHGVPNTLCLAAPLRTPSNAVSPSCCPLSS
jgi:hypothetical protein